GTHELSNLIVTCSACHQAHHDGRLVIRGTADAIVVQRAHVGVCATTESSFETSATRAQAKDALVALGWKAAIAAGAVDAAITALGGAAAIEVIIREALRRCPRPLVHTSD